MTEFKSTFIQALSAGYHEIKKMEISLKLPAGYNGDTTTLESWRNSVLNNVAKLIINALHAEVIEELK